MANDNTTGYMKRAADAIKTKCSYSSGSYNPGAPGYVTNIVDALKTVQGANPTGSKEKNFYDLVRTWVP